MLGILTAAFLAGLASTPHCAAMCGPIASYGGCGRGHGVGYHLARVLSSVALGALAGGLGELVVLQMDPALGITLMSLMLSVGLAMSAFRLWKRTTPTFPTEVSAPQLVTLRKKTETQRPRLRAAVVGAITPLLPCGSVWAALMLAVGSADILHGGLVMFVFAIPTGFAVQLAANAAGFLRRRGKNAQKMLAILLVLGAIVTALRPLDAFRESVICHLP